MWQKIILQSKPKLPDQGFITLEIIIATFVAFGFLMFSLQALAFAMLMKVQAQKDQRAEQLIQEDMERMGGLSSTNIDGDCNAPDYVDGYAQGLWDDLLAQTPANDPDLTTSLLADNTGGITLTLARTLVNADSAAPHRTLRVFYQVTSDDDPNTIIASRIVEMIPEEALECP